MKAALSVTALACLSLFAATATTTIGQTGHVTVTPPKKDGNENITVAFVLPDESGTSSISATAFGLNGKKKNADDDEQTTAEEKATELAGALQEAIDAEDQRRKNEVPPLDPTGLSATANLDSVDVSLPGGKIKKLEKTNNTREPRDTSMVTPGEGQIALGSVTLNGEISGAASEQNGTAQLWLQVGWEEYLIPTTQGMTLRELITEVQRVLELGGHRVTTDGGSRLSVVLPLGAPIFGAGSDDRTLGIERFSAAAL